MKRSQLRGQETKVNCQKSEKSSEALTNVARSWRIEKMFHKTSKVYLACVHAFINHLEIYLMIVSIIPF